VKEEGKQKVMGNEKEEEKKDKNKQTPWFQSVK
jgi:hypothetical protein